MTANDNATAATIATTVKNKLGMPYTVLIIPSDDSAIGTVVAAEAAKKGCPVLLAPKSGSIPSETYGWYEANVTNSILEVGTSDSLPGLTTQNRLVINGTDDYDTANQYAYNAFTYWGCTYAYTGLASAASGDWQSSAAAGAYLGKHAGIMLLANGQSPSTQASSALKTYSYQLDKLAYLGTWQPWQSEQAVSPYVPQAPQHTTYDLGTFASNKATAFLDSSSLQVGTSDLDIASFGPDASLGRTYSSANTTATYFAPGWRFGFEQKLTFPVANTETVYTDETGDAYTFLNSTTDPSTGFWTPPSGYSGLLTYNKTPNTWTLKPPSGDTTPPPRPALAPSPTRPPPPGPSPTPTAGAQAPPRARSPMPTLRTSSPG